MKYTIIFLFAMISFSSSSCIHMRAGKPSIKQGVFGKVTMIKGNVMPSPDAPRSNRAKAVGRTVRIYEITMLGQVEGQSPLFTKVNSKLVMKVQTDVNGYYQCKLPAGRYSIFTEEPDGKLFANLFEGNGEITPFQVKANMVTEYQISINYNAFY